jgi:hypothetical protein
MKGKPKVKKRLFFAGIILGLSAGVLRAQDGNIIIDEKDYCRAWYQYGHGRIDATALKTEGSRFLDRRAMAGLKRRAKKFHESLGIEWDKAGWMDRACAVIGGQTQGGAPRSQHVEANAYTDAPRAGWQKPDFDDSAWLRQRMPQAVGLLKRGSAGTGGHEPLARRGCYYRFHFRVPDPAQAGDLTLTMAYHGGVRVFVNGREIARGHLPDGEITPQTAGEVYPWQAYVDQTPDGKPLKYQTGKHKGEWVYLGDLTGAFDDALIPGTSPLRHKNIAREQYRNDKYRAGRQGTWSGAHDRETWERLEKLRDRKLGPVTVPAKLLRKGDNVLAVEVRASDFHPITCTGGRGGWFYPHPFRGNFTWYHAQIRTMELRSVSGRVPSAGQRPAGVQVWVEDMHKRVMEPEYNDTSRTGTLRFVGTIGGRFAGQLVVGTDKLLTGLKMAPSELKHEKTGAALPASALSVGYLVPRTLREAPIMSHGTKGSLPDLDKLAPRMAYGNPALRFGPREFNPWTASQDERRKVAENLRFFDQISRTPATEIAANACQPVWITLDVPTETTPGTYRGRITVSADGMKPVHVPVEAEIHGWRVPDPRAFQTIVTLEQNPYGVAKQYGVELWSDKHFELMEPSFEILARVGNDFVPVPVVRNSEYGNKGLPTMIKWVRKKDGSLAFDYTVLDRYLKMVTRHWGRPRVISFVVLFGVAGKKVAVDVHNEATGKIEELPLGSSDPEFHTGWKAFATSLYAHMQELGLADSMFWGLTWDSEGDPNLVQLMCQILPGVPWSAATHGHGPALKEIYEYKSFIYKLANISHKSRLGWKRPDMMVLNGRGGGTVTCLSGSYGAFGFRLVVDRALVAGVRGIGRIGADNWKGIYLDGFGGTGWLPPGLSVASLLWPGKDGAELSQRFEGLREGVQETEARIFIEQQIDRKALPAELAARAKKVLFEHNRETLFFPMGNDALGEYCESWQGWQERSGRLFSMAAEVADVVGLDVDQRALTTTLPARGKKDAILTLRNWRSKPSQWKASADKPWIVPRKTSGALNGQEELFVTLDASKLTPGAKARGTLTVTDTETGRTSPVTISAAVTKVFEYLPPDSDRQRASWRLGKFIPHAGMVPVNVAPGKSETVDVMVSSLAGTDIAWKASSSEPWLKVEPSSGRVPPETPILVKVTATPPGKKGGRREAALTFSEANGPARVKVPVAVHVIPEYVKPALPAGKTAVSLAEKYKELLKVYNGVRQGYHQGTIGGKFLRRNPRLKGFKTYIGGAAPYEAIFNIEGKGYTHFSAQVGFLNIFDNCVGMWSRPGPPTERLNYEIWVDGKLRTQSAFMGPKDPFRLLVVGGLEDASELRLVARSPGLPTYPLNLVWCNPTLWK